MHGYPTAGMDSDWLTGLLVVLMVTIAVVVLWSGTMFGKEKEDRDIILDVYYMQAVDTSLHR